MTMEKIIEEFKRICVGANGKMVTEPDVIKSFILKTLSDQQAEIIVDLYEMRASVSKPLQAEQMEKVENIFQYNFFNVVIANLCDKYKVDNEEVKKFIRERNQTNPHHT